MQTFQLHNPITLTTLKCILHYRQENSPQSYLGIEYNFNLQRFQLSIYQQHLSAQLSHHIENIKYLSEYLKQIYLRRQYQLLEINQDEIVVLFKYKSQWRGKDVVVREKFKAERKGYLIKGKENNIGHMESRIKKEIKFYVEAENSKIKAQLHILKQEKKKQDKDKHQSQQIQMKKNTFNTLSNINDNNNCKKQLSFPNSLNIDHHQEQHDSAQHNDNIIKSLKQQQQCNKIKLQQSFESRYNPQLNHLLSHQQQKIMLLRASCINEASHLQKQIKIQLQSSNLIDTLEQPHMNTLDNGSLINSESEQYQQEDNENSNEQYNQQNQQNQLIQEQLKQEFTGPLVVTSRQATRYYYSKGHGKPKCLFRNMQKKLLDKKYKQKIMTMSLQQWCETYPYTNQHQDKGNSLHNKHPFNIHVQSSIKMRPTLQDQTFYKKQPLKGFIQKDNKFMKLSSQATKMYRYFYLSLISKEPFSTKIGKQYWMVRVLGSVDLEIVIGVYNGDEKIKNDTFPRSMVGVHLGHGYVKDEIHIISSNSQDSNKKTLPSSSGPAWRHILPQSKQDPSLYLKVKQQLYQLIQKGQCYIFINLDMDNNTIEFYLNSLLLVRSKLSKNCIKNKEKVHALVAMYNEKDCIEVV